VASVSMGTGEPTRIAAPIYNIRYLPSIHYFNGLLTDRA
jgi:hypothetical protein